MTTKTTSAPTLFRAPTADGRFMYPVTDKMEDVFGEHVNLFTGFSGWVTPVTEVKAGGGYNAPRLLIVAADVTSIEYTAKSSAYPTVIKWTRDRPSTAFPAEVLPADWEEFRDSLGMTGDYHDEYIANGLYTAQRTEQEYETRSFDLSGYTDLPFDMLDLDAVVDPDPSFTWQVSAPHLVFGEMYATAMPGALTNLYERFAKDAEAALPGVTIWNHKAREGTVSGNVTLGYEDKRTYTSKVGRRNVKSPSSRSYSFDIPVPKTIVGMSKANAIERYRAVLAEVLDQIVSKKAVACAHCDGEGVIIV